MGNYISKKTRTIFESIKVTDQNGVEWWSARDLAKALGYSEYRNFLIPMRKAWTACNQSGIDPRYHFVEQHEMIKIAKGAERQIDTWFMSRYACYLSVQSADTSKPIVAQAHTYFAIQTRRAEKLLPSPLSEEDQKRLFLREELSKHNSHLAGAAKDAGVMTASDYALFQNHGYKGLYGGLDAQAIHDRKGLGKSQRILDHMGSTELAANLFRATQTEEKLRNEDIHGKAKANQVHYLVGAKVRKTIKELGGTMPENLPTAESIKRIERKRDRIAGSNSVGTEETDP